MIFKQLILLISFASLIGCTSMRPVDIAQDDFAEHISTGDHLVVYEKDGRILDMQVAKVERTELYGSLTGAGWSTVTVALADVERIEIEKISGARTTGVIVGGIVLLPIVAAFAGLGIAAELSQ